MTRNLDELIEFVEKHLYNSKGGLEWQRVSNGKYFTSRSIDSSILDRFNIRTPQDLYDRIHNESEKCPVENCCNVRRFVSLKDGYKQYCAYHSRKINNWTKQKHHHVVPLVEVLDFVKDSNGNYSTSKIKKLCDSIFNEIHNLHAYLENPSKAELLYNFENNLTGLPSCKMCNKPHQNFYSGVRGYLDNHKGKCSEENRIQVIKENDKIKQDIRKSHSENIKNRIENIPTNYTLMKKFDVSNYIKTGEDFVTIKCQEGHSFNISNRYQGKNICPYCYPTRSKNQSELYEILKQLDSELIYDDRKLLNGKEIDILSHKHKFGVEYDSLTFHSYGHSDYKPLHRIDEDSKYHLNKTLECENNDYQLFHIFSNEYLDKNKRNIWVSMLKNKMGLSSRIYARKCEVKEIDTELARAFCEENHLQGYVNSSIKIGLFYNDELVSVATFGKPRTKKYNRDGYFELLRMCTLQNFNVVGGASKLLKHFENIHTPKILISYANRRWSNGNVYDKLNFERISQTPPNYFYFKGCSDNSKLFSRIQFQKHKLKEFTGYSDDKTGTLIMYENGYRKIYDCGNYTYIKRFEI